MQLIDYLRRVTFYGKLEQERCTQAGSCKSDDWLSTLSMPGHVAWTLFYIYGCAWNSLWTALYPMSVPLLLFQVRSQALVRAYAADVNQADTPRAPGL